MSAALALVTALTLAPGPVAVHYGKGAFGAVADRRHIAWQVWGDGVEVGGRFYDGFGSSPLCGSRAVGGVIRADVYNRRTGQYEHIRLYQADVSHPADRRAQLRGGRLVELNWSLMHRLRAAIEDGWGRTPAKNIHATCGRLP